MSVNKEQIVSIVCDVFEVSQEALMGDGKGRKHSRPRQMAMYLVHELANLSTTYTGIFFNRDHTTVMYAMRRVEHWLETNEHFREKHRTILNRLADLKKKVAA